MSHVGDMLPWKLRIMGQMHCSTNVLFLLEVYIFCCEMVNPFSEIKFVNSNLKRPKIVEQYVLAIKTAHSLGYCFLLT